MASLHVVGGPDAGRRIALERGQTVIGRGTDCDLVVPSIAISRRHARLNRRAGRFVLQDLDSRGGTYLNARQVRGLAPLRHGDHIRICDFEAVFESPGVPLTEAGWAGCADSLGMLAWLRGSAGARTRGPWLCAAACRRRFFPPQGPEEFAAVEWLERCGESARRPEGGADPWETASEDARRAVESATNPLDWSLGVTGPRRRPEEELWAAYESAEGLLCGLLRCVFGNPFRPVAPDRAWRTPDVRTLSRAAYEERALPAGTLEPERLALLADALEEAGCTDAEVLVHLRGAGPHVRGCHVLDALLGKS